MTRFFRAFIILQSVLWNTFVHDSMCRKLYSGAILCHIKLYNEEFYKLKYCSTVVYMVPRA